MVKLTCLSSESAEFVSNFFKNHFGTCYAAETKTTSLTSTRKSATTPIETEVTTEPAQESTETEITTGPAQESTKTTFDQTTHSNSKAGVLQYTILMLLLPIINIIN